MEVFDVDGAEGAPLMVEDVEGRSLRRDSRQLQPQFNARKYIKAVGVFVAFCVCSAIAVAKPMFMRSAGSNWTRFSNFGSSTFNADNQINGDNNVQHIAGKNTTKVIEGKTCEGSGNAFEGGGGAAQVVCCSGPKVQCCGTAVGVLDMAKKVKSIEDAPSTGTVVETGCSQVQSELSDETRTLWDHGTFNAENQHNGDNIMSYYSKPSCFPDDDNCMTICSTGKSGPECVPGPAAKQSGDDNPGDQDSNAKVKSRIQEGKEKLSNKIVKKHPNFCFRDPKRGKGCIKETNCEMGRYMYSCHPKRGKMVIHRRYGSGPGVDNVAAAAAGVGTVVGATAGAVGTAGVAGAGLGSVGGPVGMVLGAGVGMVVGAVGGAAGYGIHALASGSDDKGDKNYKACSHKVPYRCRAILWCGKEHEC